VATAHRQECLCHSRRKERCRAARQELANRVLLYGAAVNLDTLVRNWAVTRGLRRTRSVARRLARCPVVAAAFACELGAGPSGAS
jgi:hypothetical protein